MSNIPYINRELSWLQFNDRVLELASRRSEPLLERIKFLAISASNLDEFFEVRVAGLQQQANNNVASTSPDQLSTQTQLELIAERTKRMLNKQQRIWAKLVPKLNRAGYHIKQLNNLQGSDRDWLHTHFKQKILPVLTPFAIDLTHPFPQIQNKSQNLFVQLTDTDTGQPCVAIIPIPRSLPRIVEMLPSTRQRRFFFLVDLIKLFCDELFPGYTLNDAVAFRVIRNSELYIDQEESDNLLNAIEQELRNRHRGDSVKLEIDAHASSAVVQFLVENLNIPNPFVYKVSGPLNLSRLLALYDLIDAPKLKYPPHNPINLSGDVINFEHLKRADVLLHHPYHSFQPVVDFVEQAANDPHVLALKQTLYRTSGDSPIVQSLIKAAQNGKQVTALVELRARFDEANNIQWAKRLEEAGVHVVYGLINQKIHAKASLVIRQDIDQIRAYAHIGTGNYNPKTARIYTDFSLITSDLRITKDVSQLFNSLTGFGKGPTFKHILAAPFNLHTRLQQLIERETEHAKHGRPSRIIAKMNSLVDKTTIANIYKASNAGVHIDLIIRGICCLQPELPKVSENIKVRSLLGRFLEHARVFYFENGGEAEIYISSADWMPRNFFSRVELAIPIFDTQIKQQLIEQLKLQLTDNHGAFQLTKTGLYEAIEPTRKKVNAQLIAINQPLALK